MVGALATHRAAVQNAARASDVRGAELLRRIEGGVAQLRAQVSTAQSVLAATSPEDVAALAAARRMLADAERKLGEGTAVQRKVVLALRDMRHQVTGQEKLMVEGVERGTASLRQLCDGLGTATAQFRSTMSAFQSATAAPLPSAAPTTPQPSAAPPAVGSTSTVLVDLSTIELETVSDFPHLSAGEMRDGLQRLEQDILPRVQRGEGLEQMRALDEAAGSSGSTSSYVRIYEAFFGDTAIKLSPVSPGRFEIINGRHRVHLARSMGIEALPVRLR